MTQTPMYQGQADSPDYIVASPGIGSGDMATNPEIDEDCRFEGNREKGNRPALQHHKELIKNGKRTKHDDVSRK